MAARDRPSRNTITVNAVYTPPAARRQGFAAATVAQLSRELLLEDTPRAFCIRIFQIRLRTAYISASDTSRCATPITSSSTEVSPASRTVGREFSRLRASPSSVVLFDRNESCAYDFTTRRKTLRAVATEWRACGQFKPFSFFLDRPSAPVVVKANLTAVKQNSGPDPHCAAG